MSIQILIPAQINVPSHIKKVVIANRSLPAKGEGNQLKIFLEGFITGESILADREGSMNCVDGLANKLVSSPRFEASLMNTLDLRGTGTRQFPIPLDWKEVERVCKQYNADALILLETFDSNLHIKEGDKDVKRTVDGKEIIVKEFLADLNINVNAGWRIYDIKNKRIVDESTFTDEKGWGARGENPKKARAGLPDKRRAINDAGYFAGQQYGVRISPNWIWSGRSYFVKGHDDFKTAKRFARAKDWDGAAEIWMKSTTDADPKVAGRAAYNMALFHEVKGNLDEALEWAEKAYKNYNIKKGREYINILNRRIMDQQRLEKQMEE